MERAAVDAVIAWFRNRGWAVESVERECLGFDLRCTKGRDEKNVEVKGVSGPEPYFVITRNEVQNARENPLWELRVVTSVTSGAPKVHAWSGKEFVDEFVLVPDRFFAKLQRSIDGRS